MIRPIICITCIAAGLSGRIAVAQSAREFERLRNRMVDDEIVKAGITNDRVVTSMRETPRHEFCRTENRPQAYFDMALPIGDAQTISPPFVVAYMTQELDPQPADVVLEVGTGSGYQAAILSPLVKEVYSIEIVESLGKRAARTLKRLKYDNVFTKIGDGYQGWSEHAPFDKIIVTCSPENVPQPLIDQLKEGGRMIVPLGERYQQTLYLFKKVGGKLETEALRPTLFVPMTGAAEDLRTVKPDPLRPAAVNGGFETAHKEGKEIGQPVGWHYLRQVVRTEDALAPEGKWIVRFTNAEPGRASMALQAFAVDGAKVKTLAVSLHVRASNVRPGQARDQLPRLLFTFYDENRKTVAAKSLGPWRGDFDWKHVQDTIAVPPAAREAIVHVGLLGALGTLDVDGIEYAPAQTVGADSSKATDKKSP